MLRQNKYRPQLFSESFLKSRAINLWKSISELNTMCINKQISDYEYAAIYIFLFNLARRPTDAICGPHNLFASTTLGTLRVCDVMEYFTVDVNSNLINRLRLNEENFLSYFCKNNHRSIPNSAIHTIHLWGENKLKLIIKNYIPYSIEILEMQIQRQRCLTLLVNYDEITTYQLHGRDILSFAVHDLIHAHQFFKDLSQTKDQVRFYKFMKQLLSSDEFQNALEQNLIFRQKIEYLISDMNSTYEHLLSCLKAAIYEIKKDKQIYIKICNLVGNVQNFSI